MRPNRLKRQMTKVNTGGRFFRPRLEYLEDRCVPATFTVLNTFDSGAGSLRQAILDANANAGSDTIDFNIPGPGVQTITPLSQLPDITGAVAIDGGNAGDPTNRVQISGGGTIGIGLLVPESAGGPTVEFRDLVINGFTNEEILVIFGSGHVFQGNFLGLDPSGTVVVPNSGGGIDLVAVGSAQIGGTTTTERNVITGINTSGITVDRSSATIQGNFIGLDAAGTTRLGSLGLGIAMFNGAATIGGTSAGARNVIVGHTGIEFSGNPAQGHSSGTVQGNFIGTDITGTVALNLGNGAGIDVDHAVGVVINGGNVISGNGEGVTMHSSGVSGASSNSITVQGNFIGTAADGVTPLGNSEDGIESGSCPSSFIGGLNNGEGNVIAFNGRFGVFIGDRSNNSVLGNSIFGNGGIGIDVGGGVEDQTFVTHNDVGEADGVQNFPVFTSAVTTNGNTTITGMLNSTNNTTFRLEFFASAAADPSGFGEGQTFLGFKSVTTDGAGNASFNVTFPNPGGNVISATATDPDGNTSEFSQILQPTAPARADLSIQSQASAASIFLGQEVTYNFTLTNNGPDAATNVQIVDVLAGALSITSVTTEQGNSSQNGQTVTFNIGTLAAGATVHGSVTVRALELGQLTSTATTSSDVGDPVQTNNTTFQTTDVVPLPSANVKVELSASPAVVTPGGQVAYTIVVTNSSPATATDVVLTDALPGQVTFVSLSSPAGWTIQKPAVGTNGTVTATIASLPPGAQATFQLVARVQANTPGGTQLNNSANVAATNDGDLEDNSASRFFTVQQAATTLTITYVSREAAFRSELGLFLIDDASGRIGDLNPGDPGYAAAAMARRQVIFTRAQRPGTVRHITIPPGILFGFYLIQNDSSANFLLRNPTNRVSHGPRAFFSINAANPDHVAHIRWRSANLFGFEDLTGGGDRDFNDLVARIRVGPTTHLTNLAPNVISALLALASGKH